MAVTKLRCSASSAVGAPGLCVGQLRTHGFCAVAAKRRKPDRTRNQKGDELGWLRAWRESLCLGDKGGGTGFAKE